MVTKNENNANAPASFTKIESPSTYSSSKRTPNMIQEQIRVVSGCATNIISSIAIIFLNKYIFSHCQIKTMTLTAIHMLITSLGLCICLKFNTFTRKTAPFIKVLPLSIAYCAFVVFTNLSLEYNTIGTYQLFKVLTTPVVALISWQYYKTKYSQMVILTLIPVVVGVCTHSVNDIKLTIFGTIIASIGVLSASLYQVWVGERLKELDMNSQQLLFYQAPLSTVLLVPFILYMESIPSYQTTEEQRNALTAVIASGFVAFVVNLSVYWVIKNTSALTYNMIGHMKTVSILVGGFLLFQDTLNFKQFIGILLTLFGLFAYTFVRMSEQNQLPCKQWNANPVASMV
jgi:solute carrier family 35 protein E3